MTPNDGRCVVWLLCLCCVVLASCSRTGTGSGNREFKYLRVHGSSGRSNVRGETADALSWYSEIFYYKALRKLPRPPKIEVVKEQICDDLGNKYTLDDITCGERKGRLMGGDYSLILSILQSRIAQAATQVSLDVVISIEGRKFRMEDRMIKTGDPDSMWISETELRKQGRPENGRKQK